MREGTSWLSFRLLTPQVLTASRVVFSAAAILCALASDRATSARLIVGGAITDMLDGPVATWLGAVTDFGALFDYFADYLCYVVAPVVLCYTVVPAHSSRWPLVLTSLPLLTGAIRYGRNGSLLHHEEFAKVGYPGLGTNFFAMFIVGTVLLDWHTRLGSARFAELLSIAVPLFSVLMIVRVRYPKLTASKPLAAAVLLYLLLLPFVLTKILAAGMLIIVLAYAVISPFLVQPRSVRKLSQAESDTEQDLSCD